MHGIGLLILFLTALAVVLPVLICFSVLSAAKKKRHDEMVQRLESVISCNCRSAAEEDTRI